jgi:hypothetical protein
MSKIYQTDLLTLWRFDGLRNAGGSEMEKTGGPALPAGTLSTSKMLFGREPFDLCAAFSIKLWGQFY